MSSPAQLPLSPLLTLPTELRHQILALCLPPSISLDKPWASSFLDILHVCMLLRRDLAYMLKYWDPLLYVTALGGFVSKFGADASTSVLTPITMLSEPISPTNQRIRLNIFHSMPADAILNSYYGEISTYRAKCWLRCVQLLPETVKHISLDITPAPTQKNAGHTILLDPFLRDKRALRFFTLQVDDLSALVIATITRFPAGVTIELTGRLSTKSEPVVRSICDDAFHHTGLTVSFVGTWIPATGENWWTLLENAAATLTPSPKQARAAARNGTAHRLSALRSVAWCKESRWAWAKVAFDGDGDGALADLRALVEFWVDGRRTRLEMEPVEPLRRALQHKIVGDLRMESEGEGEGKARRVVVRKRGKGGWFEEEGRWRDVVEDS
ncbi:hypothetical protein IQ07DRAFT_634754 [Pyrenochaeta sp. DS3sAY3a]|nr:hypothetical protein IQ07DRAFT_634754 [Pyrenochaeta sp. DS3sAY3a]